MKNLSLKLDKALFEETEKIISDLNISRNRYINKAVAFYNELQQRRLLARQLEKESHLVRDESLKILEELEQMEGDADSTI